jgi:hypothetical protein
LFANLRGEKTRPQDSQTKTRFDQLAHPIQSPGLPVPYQQGTSLTSVISLSLRDTSSNALLVKCKIQSDVPEMLA